MKKLPALLLALSAPVLAQPAAPTAPDWYFLSKTSDGHVGYVDLANVAELRDLRHVRIRGLTDTQYALLAASVQGLTGEELNAAVNEFINKIPGDFDLGVTIDCTHHRYLEDGEKEIQDVQDGSAAAHLEQTVCADMPQPGAI